MPKDLKRRCAKIPMKGIFSQEEEELMNPKY